MALGYVTLEIDQGEDWSAQVIISDQWENAVKITEPIQMDIKDRYGTLVMRMNVPNPPPTDSSIPEITYSPASGLVQLHITRDISGAMDAGVYNYDLFVTATDDDVYAGNQRLRVLEGKFIVYKRITEMT